MKEKQKESYTIGQKLLFPLHWMREATVIQVFDFLPVTMLFSSVVSLAIVYLQSLVQASSSRGRPVASVAFVGIAISAGLLLQRWLGVSRRLP